jgi:putative acetyltransferase
MPASVTFRAYRAGDAAALRAIFLAAVSQTARRFYDARQVEAWAGRAASVERYEEKAADGRTLLVALDGDGRPCAYGDVEPDGHIDHLFCRPDVTGTGVASALYDALEQAARAQGVARLHVEASEAARPLFTRKGFELIARNDFTIGEGVPIHNWRMAKQLDP